MNTEEDWKRERDLERCCRHCDGRGWVIDRYAPSGGSPCGCDEPQEDDTLSVGTEPLGEVNQAAISQAQQVSRG